MVVDLRIRVNQKVKDFLDKKKKHKREPYNDVLIRLLNLSRGR